MGELREELSRVIECDVCVRACPYDAIHNALWTLRKNRDDLIDAFKCSRKREEFIPIIGHKHECGLCLLACPVGSN